MLDFGSFVCRFIEFAGSMLRVGGKQQTDIIRLKASSLNSFLNLPYDAVHGMSFELLANLKPGQILDLLKEVFDLNREQQSKINIPALSLSVLNLCDVEDSIRKTLRKAILPPKWYRKRHAEGWYPYSCSVLQGPVTKARGGR